MPLQLKYSRQRPPRFNCNSKLATPCCVPIRVLR